MTSTASWYQKFKQRQNEINTRQGAFGNSLSAADRVAMASIGDFDTSSYFKKDMNFGDHLWDAGGRFLDIISRPGYTTGGFLNSVLEQATDDNPDFSIGDALYKAGQGFIGREKEFFSPFQILEDPSPHTPTPDKIMGGITDFVTSVLTDPLTYAGVGLIAKPLKAGADAIGATKKFDSATKAGVGAIEQVEQLKQPTLNNDFLKSILQMEESPQGWNLAQRQPGNIDTAPLHNLGVQPEPPSIQSFLMDQNNGRWGLSTEPEFRAAQALEAAKPENRFPHVPVDPMTPKQQAIIDKANSFTGNMKREKGFDKGDYRGIYEIVLNSLRSSLRGVQGNFDSSKLKSLWKTQVDELADDAPFVFPSQIPKPAAKEFPEIPRPEGKPGVPVEEAFNTHIIKRAIIDSIPAKFRANKPGRALDISRKNPTEDVVDLSTMTLYYGGQKLDLGAWLRAGTGEGESFLAGDKGLAAFLASDSPAKSIKMGGAGNEVSLAAYANMLRNPEKVSKVASVRVKGEPVSIKDYSKSRFEKWEAQAKGTVPSAEDLKKYEAAVAAQNAEKAAYEATQKAYEEAVLKATATSKGKRVKPTKAELEAALKANGILLSAKEKRAMLSTLNFGEKAFGTAVDKMAQTSRRLNIGAEGSLSDALGELAAGVKSGRIPKEIQDEIFAKLGAKTLGQAKQKVKQLETTLEKLNQEKAAKQAQEALDAAKIVPPETAPISQFDPEAIGRVPHKIKDPHTPVAELIDNGTKITPNKAEAIVDAVVTPDIAAALNGSDKEFIVGAMKAAVKREWDRSMKYVTNRGARSTSPTPGKGLHSWVTEFNEQKQYWSWNTGMQHFGAEATKLGLKGKKRADYIYQKLMPYLAGMDEALRSHGLHPTTGVGGTGYPLSLYDILSALPPGYVKGHAIEMLRHIPPSKFIDLAHQAIEASAHVDDLAATFGGTLPGVTSTSMSAAWRNNVAASLGSPEKIKMPGKGTQLEDFAKSKEVTKDGITNIQEAEKIRDAAIDPLASEKFIKAMQEKVRYNSARANIQYGEFVDKHSNADVKAFMETVLNAKTDDAVFDAIDTARRSVGPNIKKTSDIVPSKAEVSAVQDAVEQATLNPLSEIAKEQRARYLKLDGGGNRNQRINIGVKSTEALNDLLFEMVPMVDMAQHIEMSMMGSIIHKMFPHIAEGPLRHLLLEGNIAAGAITERYSVALSGLQHKFGTDRIKQAFRDIAAGVEPQAVDGELFEQMNTALSRIFGDNMGSYSTGKGWSLAGNGIDPRHMNANLRAYRVPDNFRLKADEGLPWSESYKSWTEWADAVEDPLDIMSRYHAALQRTVAEKAFGENLVANFGSTVKKPGYVKIKDVKGSRIAHLIDTTKYYPPEIVQNMRALDQTLFDMTKPAAGSKYSLVRTFDSATQMLKKGLTIYRPGHHSRNFLGDVWLGAMDGVVNPAYYKRSLQVMKSRKDHYADFNFDASLSDKIYTNQDTVLRLGAANLSADDVYRLATRHGVFPGYKTIEDLEIGSKLGDAADKFTGFKPFGGRVHKVATGVSEYETHYTRGAHFLHAMEREAKALSKGNKNWKPSMDDIQQMASRASARVRKWHPDGSDLTKLEKDYLRRGVLFYSWIRKAIPLVIESVALRPGRALVFPKGMYQMAQAQGIDLNGFSDPFPRDQLFPSWLGGLQGPVMGNAWEGYLGVRPGNPMMDVLDQYFQSPGEAFQTVMSSLNPAIRMPLELYSGETAQGIPINDTPKYLLGQVPFGNFVNTMVGRPIGGTSPSDEGYDPGGIRDRRSLALINMLTGLGVMDMSRPSYVKSGEFDVKYGRTNYYD